MTTGNRDAFAKGEFRTGAQQGTPKEPVKEPHEVLMMGRSSYKHQPDPESIKPATLWLFKEFKEDFCHSFPHLPLHVNTSSDWSELRMTEGKKLRKKSQPFLPFSPQATSPKQSSGHKKYIVSFFFYKKYIVSYSRL